MNDARRELVSARLLPLQIIVGAMALGAIAFLIVAAVVPVGPASAPVDAPPAPILTYVCVGFGVVALVARLLIPGIVTASVRASLSKQQHAGLGTRPQRTPPVDAKGMTDEMRLCVAYATLVVVRAAAVEGAALLAVLAYLIEGETLAAVVAIVLILALVAQVPTHTAMAQWLDAELRHREQTRPVSV